MRFKKDLNEGKDWNIAQQDNEVVLIEDDDDDGVSTKAHSNTNESKCL